MPAIPHVTRRGAIYYWRRRLPVEFAQSKKSTTLLLGLRTSDSRRARFLASQITALVDLHFLPAIMNQHLSQQQIQSIFRDVFTRHLSKLELVVARERMEPDFNAEDSRRFDRLMGWVYRLLETRGRAAAVDPRARDAMTADGLGEADIDEVAALLSMMQRQRQAAEPPERLAAIVEGVGGEPNPVNLGLAQEQIYRAMAEANFQTARRYDGIRVEDPLQIDEILKSRMSNYVAPMPVVAPPESHSPRPAQSSATLQGLQNLPSAGQVEPKTDIPGAAQIATVNARSETHAPGIAMPSKAHPGSNGATITLDEHPFVVFGEKLITRNGKSSDWDEKTQRQARQIYRLFGKLLLEQSLVDLTDLRQSHFGLLQDLLASVAKSYGKSSKDELRTTAQLRAIGAARPDADRGLAPETLNRHLTFLGQILVFIKGQGVALDRDIDLSLLRGKTRNSRGRQKRALFSPAELAAIFNLPCFKGCAGWTDKKAVEPGPYIFHRGLYFAIILLYYTGARREEICGLTVDDVQNPELIIEGNKRQMPCIYIRVNEARRVKNEQSIRMVALLPEVIRLGFLDYVAAIKALGYKLVFPDLKSPTSKSPMGDRLYDEFKRGLDRVLPDASARKKVLHSFRKTFGDSLKQAGVEAEIRGDILGHGGETVTEEIYCNPIALETMMTHLLKLPTVTAHLKPHPIRLLPWVQQKFKPPFSRKSRLKLLQ